ncbi:MAG TPA: cysteine hydrolase family protein [Stellaceae bacterium]|nr:cysteine hydrolase family protein [Stellaceae bacterium]
MATALLIIDVQQGMFMLSRPLYQGQQVVERIASLLERARSENVSVFHVRHNGGPGHILERETAGWRLHPLVSPQKHEPVVDKQHSSCFQDTTLHQQLQASQIDKVVIAGMQTEYCVDSACRAAAALGYRSVLVSDAHTTFDTSVLSAVQIIAHHNLTLGDGFAELALNNEVRL